MLSLLRAACERSLTHRMHCKRHGRSSGILARSQGLATPLGRKKEEYAILGCFALQIVQIAFMLALIVLMLCENSERKAYKSRTPWGVYFLKPESRFDWCSTSDTTTAGGLREGQT
uniref:Uncharacterized protein n=1 Tax=mine drainage metagenome TaxID=410659 RepID=E6PWU5_9ZZZZ